VAKKRKIYLDTSIISAFFDKRVLRRMVKTVEWIRNDIYRYDLFLSDLVIEEITATRDDSLRARMLELIDQLTPTRIDIDDEIKELALAYRRIVIPGEISDSIHIAAASCYQLDAIVSWNFTHIVNLRTISGIHQINREKSLKIIEILSPEYLGADKYA
jgi:predicted nucleic acid-binding protein